MRQSDALRIVNKCKQMYPLLDFTNIVLVDRDSYQYRFGAESAGLCKGNGDIYVKIPEIDEIILYQNFMTILVHEAIHRYVLFTYGEKHYGHGRKFQEACIKFGLDPVRETSHDDTVKRRIYPMNRKDYLKYRHDWGDLKDPWFDDDILFALYKKHKKTYSRKYPAYDRHWESVEKLGNK